MAKNSLIPNTFQHPNAYIDWLSYYLTPEEEKVLNKAIREIIGWHDKVESRRSRIALSIFVDGKFQDGKRVAMGCGLSRDTVRKTLASLDAFKILKKIGDPTNEGQEYELNLDYDSLDWNAIETRRKEQKASDLKRMSAAREKLEENRQERGTVAQTAEGVLSDSNKETQASLETQVPAPKEAQESIQELEYVDDEDTFEDNPHSKKRPNWQIPDTQEQKDFLAICGAKWFESKQKGKAKAFIKAFEAGDIAGKDVYQGCLKYLEDRTELVDVPPLMPRDWYQEKATHAITHYWSRQGFINALLNRDKLAEHCQIKQRELDRAGLDFKTIEEVEAEMRQKEPVVVGGTYMPPGFSAPLAEEQLRQELERRSDELD